MLSSGSFFGEREVFEFLESQNNITSTLNYSYNNNNNNYNQRVNTVIAGSNSTFILVFESKIIKNILDELKN